jgi:tetratricopeptide (TPR) repeat protein
MSELRIERYTMPGADVGPENPLPPLDAHRDLHQIGTAPGVPDEIVRNAAYGHVPNPLPYTMQDQYTRQRTPREFKVAVLENEILRATFLLELGGRLWSLLHKPSGRELLDVNPVLQPANLAIRNAWFCGGVEWNIGTIGHCVFTCSPLFAACIEGAPVEGTEGMPVLRFYEWERMRQVPFQIDVYLPDRSPVLYVRVRIVNPHPHSVPMYWWSNIAVPETPDTRIVVPAESAYTFSYGPHGLKRVAIPTVEGRDVTYTVTGQRSADYFFHVPDGQRPWIAALDGYGRGLVQCSTARLQGRKLFLWGQGPGGKRWQTFLAEPGHTYLEIQAGLARTQAEHLPMPAETEWSWLEAYGLMEADAATVHGTDWDAAWRAVDAQLESLLPTAELEAEYERGKAWADHPPAEIVQRGSGWGALERLRREAHGEPPFCSPGLVFDQASLSPAQAPWIDLLQERVLPPSDPTQPPQGYLIQTEWRDMLEYAVRTEEGAHWAAWLHLGLMRYAAGETEAARQAWQQSLAHTATPWAARNLAVLAAAQGHADRAVELYLEACRLAPSLLPLAVECGKALLAAGRAALWLELLAELPDEIRRAGRVRLLEGQAALETHDFSRVERLFSDTPEVSDLREGERSLSQLWFEYHEERLCVEEGIPCDAALRARVRAEFPVPPEIDFRMSPDG